MVWFSKYIWSSAPAASPPSTSESSNLVDDTSPPLSPTFEEADLQSPPEYSEAPELSEPSESSDSEDSTSSSFSRASKRPKLEPIKIVRPPIPSRLEAVQIYSPPSLSRPHIISPIVTTFHETEPKSAAIPFPAFDDSVFQNSEIERRVAEIREEGRRRAERRAAERREAERKAKPKPYVPHMLSVEAALASTKPSSPWTFTPPVMEAGWEAPRDGKPLRRPEPTKCLQCALKDLPCSLKVYKRQREVSCDRCTRGGHCCIQQLKNNLFVINGVVRGPNQQKIDWVMISRRIRMNKYLKDTAPVEAYEAGRWFFTRVPGVSFAEVDEIVKDLTEERMSRIKPMPKWRDEKKPREAMAFLEDEKHKRLIKRQAKEIDTAVNLVGQDRDDIEDLVWALREHDDATVERCVEKMKLQEKAFIASLYD